jgi:hypothetical protein
MGRYSTDVYQTLLREDGAVYSFQKEPLVILDVEIIIDKMPKKSVGDIQSNLIINISGFHFLFLAILLLSMLAHTGLRPSSLIKSAGRRLSYWDPVCLKNLTFRFLFKALFIVNIRILDGMLTV